MLFNFVLVAAYLACAFVCVWLAAKQEKMIERVNQLDTMLATYSVILNNVKETAEIADGTAEEMRNALSDICDDIKRIERLVEDKGELDTIRIEKIEAGLRELNARFDELPVDELIETQKQEAAYMQGMQNIFNYGGEIQKLNLEALKNE